MIGPIQLYNGLMTLLGYDNLTIKLHFDMPQPSTSPSGSLLSPGRHSYERTGSGQPANLRKNLAAPAASFDWGKWALTLLRNWAVLFLFGLLALWLGRKVLKVSGEAIQSHPWRALGTGLLVLVISLASIGAVLLVAVILFAIGLGLNSGRTLAFDHCPMGRWLCRLGGGTGRLVGFHCLWNQDHSLLFYRIVDFGEIGIPEKLLDGPGGITGRQCDLFALADSPLCRMDLRYFGHRIGSRSGLVGLPGHRKSGPTC